MASRSVLEKIRENTVKIQEKYKKNTWKIHGKIIEKYPEKSGKFSDHQYESNESNIENTSHRNQKKTADSSSKRIAHNRNKLSVNTQ